MKNIIAFAVLLFAPAAFPQAATGAPAGANGICKDGSYSTAASKSGACRGHKGVQTWYKADLPAAPPPTPGKSTSMPAPTPKSAAASMPAPASATVTQSMPAPSGAAASAARPAPTSSQSVPSRPIPTTGSSVPARPAPTPATNTPTMPASQPGQTTSKSGIASESAGLKAGPAAAGGGPGLVWVNTSSKVYHCPGSDFYGKTKAGSYMPEADARAQGARADHNKPCS